MMYITAIYSKKKSQREDMQQNNKREQKGAAIGGGTIRFFFYTVQLPSRVEEFITGNLFSVFHVTVAQFVIFFHKKQLWQMLP